MVQLVRVELKRRVTLQHDMVLIELSVHGIDQSLTEGVIESVINRRGRDAETRSSHTINREIHGEAARLLIARDILQLGQLLQASDESIGPIVQFTDVGVFEGVLVL